MSNSGSPFSWMKACSASCGRLLHCPRAAIAIASERPPTLAPACLAGHSRVQVHSKNRRASPLVAGSSGSPCRWGPGGGKDEGETSAP